MNLENGSIINQYKILSPIGKGGMGEVFLAQDTKLDRRVALKILPPEFAGDADRMSRFVREAKAVSALNHPNVITIHEIGESEGAHFIATEFIDGKTLTEYAKSNPLNYKSALEIAIQIVSALDEAHGAGIVHRDLKPDNIMIRANGLVKILDFGIAKLAEASPAVNVSSEDATALKPNPTNPGMIIGTASYMSPEQATGKQIDARSDIFSFGIVFYEMLSGRRAFAGETPLESISSILKDAPAPLHQTLPDIPNEIERIAGKALRKERDERYQTAKDLLIDLKDAKRDLEFQDKPERSIIPNQDADNTRTLQATTLDEINRTTNQTLAGNPKRKYFAAGLLAMLLAVGGFFGYKYFAPTGKQIESIAVMPFVNESGNQDAEYLSDGMTETLINNLSQLSHLNVKARSSVFRYKGKETNPQAIGKELNVQAILNGRIVQRGEQLILSLELIDAQTENVIWSETYNRKQTDLVSLQSEIARDVSSKLKTKLSGADAQRVAKTYTQNAEAYRLYLQGRFYWNKRDEKEFRKAVEYFNQAIALDPNYALAFAGLADAYALLATFGWMPPSEGMTKAREFARQALSLDESLAEPHATLGVTLISYGYDFAGAEREYRRAIELDPNYLTAHQWYGELLTCLGRFDEAAAEYGRALEIDPLSLPANWEYARFFYYARRFDEAIAQHKKVRELDAGFQGTYRTLAQVYRAKGDYAKAIEEQAGFFELSGEPQNAALIREAFAKGGWNGYLRLVTAENSPLKFRHAIVARAYLELGEKDKAFDELDKAYEMRESPMQFLKVEPQFDPLRGDPRFQELLKKVGFPQ